MEELQRPRCLGRSARAASGRRARTPSAGPASGRRRCRRRAARSARWPPRAASGREARSTRHAVMTGISTGTYSPPSGARPRRSASPSADRRRRAARAHEHQRPSSMVMTRAPCVPTGETQRSAGTAGDAVAQAAAMARPAAVAPSSVAASANIDGPEPDRLHPRAPAVDRRLLDGVEARHQAGALRLGHVVLERPRQQARGRPSAARRPARRRWPTGAPPPSRPRCRRAARAPCRYGPRWPDAAPHRPGPAGTGSRTMSGGSALRARTKPP